MPVATILEIIRLNLEIFLKILDGLTPDQRSQLWAEHEQRQAFWQGLVKKLSPDA